MSAQPTGLFLARWAQAAVILVVTNSRLIMENVLKYGFRAGHFAFWFAHPLRAVPLLVTWVGLSVFAAVRAPRPPRRRTIGPTTTLALLNAPL